MFCHIEEYDYRDLTEASDGLNQLRQQKTQAILIHNVLSDSELESIMSDLSSHTTPFVTSHFPEPFKSHFYGVNVNLCPPDLTEYFHEAETFQQQLSTYPDNHFNLQQRIQNVLSSIDNGRQVSAAHSEEYHQDYMFMTFRHHEPQGYIPAHCDNEFFVRPSYEELCELCQPDIYSYVLCLAEPESGGRTLIYDYTQPNVSHTLMSSDRRQKPDTSVLEHEAIATPAGSMLVFDSGRYLHSLEHIGGNQSRWTTCSFMALTKDESTLYCWG